MFKFNGRELADYDLVKGRESYDELGINSYLDSATWADNGKELTETELDQLNDDCDLIAAIVTDFVY